jgi:hypothetical protein
VDKEYRLFVAIVMTFWVIAIAAALVAAIVPSWSHFGV